MEDEAESESDESEDEKPESRSLFNVLKRIKNKKKRRKWLEDRDRMHFLISKYSMFAADFGGHCVPLDNMIYSDTVWSR